MKVIMPYVKICGITTMEDARLALRNGADLLGMVFYVHSKRVCTLSQARQIIKENILKPNVLVFSHDDPLHILETYKELESLMTFLQIPHDHNDFGKIEKEVGFHRIIPSVSVKHSLQERDLLGFEKYSLIILDNPGGIDPKGKVIAGGTGKTFNWEWVEKISRPFLLAGGLTIENIAKAKQKVSAFGYDVAGGVELKYGIKDKNKLAIFIQKAKGNNEIH